MHKHLSCYDPGRSGISHPCSYERVVRVIPTRRSLENPTGRGVFETPTCLCRPGEYADSDEEFAPGHFAQHLILINE